MPGSTQGCRISPRDMGNPGNCLRAGRKSTAEVRNEPWCSFSTHSTPKMSFFSQACYTNLKKNSIVNTLIPFPSFKKMTSHHCESFQMMLRILSASGKKKKKKKKEPRLGATDLKNAFCVVPSFIYFSSTDFPDTSTEKPRHHLDASVSARLNFKSLGTCQQQAVVNYTTLPTQFFPYNIKISTKCFHSFMSQPFFFFFCSPGFAHSSHPRCCFVSHKGFIVF